MVYDHKTTVHPYMKNCPRCSSSHTKPGTYCSRKCANVRVFTAESNRKRSIAMTGRKFGPKTPTARQNQSQACLEKYQQTPFDLLGSDNRRRRVFEEQDYHCNKCKLGVWMNKPITLELEHKDGNPKNNVRSNLEALCPNCHSYTETWRGRNRSTKNTVGSSNDKMHA